MGAISAILRLLGSTWGRAGLGALAAGAVLFGVYSYGHVRGHEGGYEAGHEAGYATGWNAAVAEQRRINEAVTRTGLAARERRRACVDDIGGTWNVVTGTCDLRGRE